MARVSGPTIDPKASYEAIELVGGGMYRLQKKDASAPDPDGFLSIKISQQTARRIGRHKLPGESLAQAVERLALTSLPGKNPVQKP